MRNIFAYLATASVVSVSAPVAAESSELRLFQRLAVFHEQLLAGSDKRTNPRGLASTVFQAKNRREEYRVAYAKALTFAALLEGAGSREEQEFLYAELCSCLQDIAPEFGMHAFRCNETGKFWIAKEEEIRNPYLSDMRDSGTKLN